MIQNWMKRLHFPSDAQEDFMAALNRIWKDTTAKKRFETLLRQYEESECCSYEQMLTDVRILGKSLGIHEYTISMLLFLCMAEKLKSRYAERGIDESIYYNSMMDLSYKLEECRLVHGVNGSFVADWFPGFFDLTRFALGRLQFEIVKTKEEYQVGGIVLPVGSKAINVHIPRTGTRLEHEEVIEAYRMAAEMFAEEFSSQPMVFLCDSWLLDPWNLTVLSPESNLAAFCRDFQIVKSGEYEGYGEVWRLFDCLYTGDASELPRNTSFRRAYAERIERGEPTGWGIGLFLYS